MTGRSPDIDVPEDVSRAWDLVVLGGPVWGARPAPPVRRYLKGHIGHTSKLALFVTCNGTSPLYPPERAITEMGALAPQRPMATRVFNQAQISGSALATNVASFAAELAAAARL